MKSWFVWNESFANDFYFQDDQLLITRSFEANHLQMTIVLGSPFDANRSRMLVYLNWINYESTYFWSESFVNGLPYELNRSESALKTTDSVKSSHWWEVMKNWFIQTESFSNHSPFELIRFWTPNWLKWIVCERQFVFDENRHIITMNCS